MTPPPTYWQFTYPPADYYDSTGRLVVLKVYTGKLASGSSPITLSRKVVRSSSFPFPRFTGSLSSEGGGQWSATAHSFLEAKYPTFPLVFMATFQGAIKFTPPILCAERKLKELCVSSFPPRLRGGPGLEAGD